MASPVTPAEVCATTPSGSGSVCDRLRALFRINPLLCTWFNYFYKSDGTVKPAAADDILAAQTAGTDDTVWASVNGAVGWRAAAGLLLPEVDGDDNGKLIGVVNGQYALVDAPVYAFGSKFRSGSGATPEFVVPKFGDDPVIQAHGLGGVPYFYRAELVCRTAYDGFSVGDVIAADQINDTGHTTNSGSPMWMVGADATSVRVWPTDKADEAGNYYAWLPDYSGASAGMSGTLLVPANWRMRLVAVLV